MKTGEANEFLNPTGKKSAPKPEAGLGLRALGGIKKLEDDLKAPGNEFEECLKQIDGKNNFSIFKTRTTLGHLPYYHRTTKTEPKIFLCPQKLNPKTT
jgi:hypothetical protein